jgi:hypothetical protein
MLYDILRGLFITCDILPRLYNMNGSNAGELPGLDPGDIVFISNAAENHKRQEPGRIFCSMYLVHIISYMAS